MRSDMSQLANHLSEGMAIPEAGLMAYVPAYASWVVLPQPGRMEGA